MILVWMSLLIELLVFYIFKPFIENEEFFAVLILLINIPFVLYMIGKYHGKFFLILFPAFFIRLLFMFVDIYGKNYITLPHSGGDSEGFLAAGIKISQDLSLMSEEIYGGLYSKILGLIFDLGPADRIIGQYINVLLGITTIVIVWKIFTNVVINDKLKLFSIFILAVFPSAIIFSSILL